MGREGSTRGCSSITAITPSGEGEELESITVPSIRAPYTAAAREARYPQKGPNINLPIEQPLAPPGLSLRVQSGRYIEQCWSPMHQTGAEQSRCNIVSRWWGRLAARRLMEQPLWRPSLNPLHSKPIHFIARSQWRSIISGEKCSEPRFLAWVAAQMAPRPKHHCNQLAEAHHRPH